MSFGRVCLRAPRTQAYSWRMWLESPALTKTFKEKPEGILVKLGILACNGILQIPSYVVDLGRKVGTAMVKRARGWVKIPTSSEKEKSAWPRRTMLGVAHLKCREVEIAWAYDITGFYQCRKRNKNSLLYHSSRQLLWIITNSDCAFIKCQTHWWVLNWFVQFHLSLKTRQIK